MICLQNITPDVQESLSTGAPMYFSYLWGWIFSKVFSELGKYGVYSFIAIQLITVLILQKYFKTENKRSVYESISKATLQTHLWTKNMKIIILLPILYIIFI